MRRIKMLFAALCLATIIAVVPAANAQTVHFVGAGSSAQWQEAALGAYNKAQGLVTGTHGSGTGACSYHFTAKGNNSDLNPAAQLIDTRNSNIPNEPGNVWIIWIGDCNATNPGTTNVTDIWLDVTVDSTVGVRAFFASQKVSTTLTVQGTQVDVDASARTSSDAIKAALWADATADTTPLPTAVSTKLNTGGPQGSFVRVNVGLTDIRPEDALFASTRALAAYNGTTLAGLGYNHGPLTGIGNSIYSDITATAIATPIKFYLAGTDPLGKGVIKPFATLPVGAAPIVYIMNDGGTTPLATDIEDGLNGPIGGSNYPLANLLDGTSVCDPSNNAFNGTGVGTTPLVVFLREPLSGTMNTNEFSVVRITGNGFSGTPSSNFHDSQEKGVTSTTTAPFNPMNIACPTHGFRRRGVGTGDIVTGVTGTSNSLGYIFFSFGNVSGIASNAKYNYLTLDGVDPLAVPGTTNQELPLCSVPNCTQAAVWGTGNLSYPHLRDGTYRDWSLYRWVGQPGSPNFCSTNASSNPIAACQSATVTPTTKATYNNTTGVATLTFGAATPAAVGEVVAVSGFTGVHALYNCGACIVLKVTNTATVHSFTYQLSSGLHLTADTTDAGTAVLSPATDPYGVQALAQAAQDAVDTGVDDFVPFNPTTGSDGLNVYRSHSTYDYSSTQDFIGNNGPLVTSGPNTTRGGGAEAGSDVGGCIELADVDVITGVTDDTGCKQ
ncbi:MAG: hypothetical protein WB421_04555 [Terriglobales bacterium]